MTVPLLTLRSFVKDSIVYHFRPVAPEPLGTGGHGPLHSETVGGHGGAQKALNVANAMLEMEIKQ